MTSIGTLFAFILVCAGVWIMRVRRPDLPRGFTRAGAAGRRDARHRRLRRDDLRPRLDQLAAARRLAGDRPGVLLRLRPKPQPAARRTRAKPGADVADRDASLKGDRWFRAQGPVFAVALLVCDHRRRHGRLRGRSRGGARGTRST